MKITLEMLLTSFYSKNVSRITNIHPTFTSEVFPTQLSSIKDISLDGIRLFPKNGKKFSENFLYAADILSAAELKKIPSNIPVVCFSKYDI